MVRKVYYTSHWAVKRIQMVKSASHRFQECTALNSVCFKQHLQTAFHVCSFIRQLGILKFFWLFYLLFFYLSLQKNVTGTGNKTTISLEPCTTEVSSGRWYSNFAWQGVCSAGLLRRCTVPWNAFDDVFSSEVRHSKLLVVYLWLLSADTFYNTRLADSHSYIAVCFLKMVLSVIDWSYTDLFTHIWVYFACLNFQHMTV